MVLFAAGLLHIESRLGNVEGGCQSLDLNLDETSKRIDRVREELTAKSDNVNRKVDAIYLKLSRRTHE